MAVVNFLGNSPLLAVRSSLVDLGTAQTCVNFGSGWRIYQKNASQHLVWLGIRCGRVAGEVWYLWYLTCWLGSPWYLQITVVLFLRHFGATQCHFGMKNLPCSDGLAQDLGPADSFCQARLTALDRGWKLSKIDSSGVYVILLFGRLHKIKIINLR